MSYDKQCSSCGGFCGRGGCKRENVKLPARKPLTDREITSLMINHDFDSAYRDRIHSLIRAVELTHGIGEA